MAWVMDGRSGVMPASVASMPVSSGRDFRAGQRVADTLLKGHVLAIETAAYWLMLALRDAVPRTMPLTWAEFATLRQSLLKIGARVVERAARIRIDFASACPDAALFRLLAGRLAATGL